ncbi:MAG: hypothetical protein GX625_05070, partial [Clostridiaceae bacterium]|nr:hypothetical protein [Clostridiaceae bacterium]
AGSLSGAGESKFDLPLLLSRPDIFLNKFGTNYVTSAITNRDAVPHHVGMAISEAQPDGTFKTYVMQINPEKPSAQTMVSFEVFAKDNLTVKVIMPEYPHMPEIAAIWRKLDFPDGTDISGRGYDFSALVGYRSNGSSGQDTAICSEDVFKQVENAMKYLSPEKRKPIDEVFKGVTEDNRITPWDFFKARRSWDRDLVEEYRYNNPADFEHITRNTHAN